MAVGVKRHKHDIIDIMDCICLKAVGESPSMLVAAEKVMVTQPLITYRIKLLENFFQRQLLYRRYRSQPHELTPFGKTMYNKACAVVKAHYEFMHVLEIEKAEFPQDQPENNDE
jgi:DNA-binding transcriptional LysR family regulator